MVVSPVGVVVSSGVEALQVVSREWERETVIIIFISISGLSYARLLSTSVPGL